MELLRLQELKQSLRIVGQVLDRYDVSSDQAQALLRVVTDTARALDILDDYDHQRVRLGRVRRAEARGIDYAEAIAIVAQLRTTFGGSGFSVAKRTPACAAHSAR